ncbi:MAG: hypothetical protein GY705_19315 [Bacteroidetes bacterium]|nr:hypothetical protein [Bacteroidota bacterium]
MSKQIDNNIDFLWGKSPISDLLEEIFVARWTSILKPSNSGKYIFGGDVNVIIEGEEMSIGVDGFSHGDRTHIKLPAVQEVLLKKLKATGKPIVYVNFSGSAMALNWQNENLSAIVQGFHPGEHTGTALARLFFGDFSPSGKLPVTFYDSADDLPPFKEYAMKNRTYRYFEAKPMNSR